MIQLCLLSIRDVNARADITQKRTVDIEHRCTSVEHPAILAVLSAQAILHSERLPFVESILVNRQAVSEVLGMHCFYPTFAAFLFHCSSSEIEPAFVEESAALIRI